MSHGDGRDKGSAVLSIRQPPPEVLPHELIVSQLRIRGTDAVDFLRLAGAESFGGV